MCGPPVGGTFWFQIFIFRRRGRTKADPIAFEAKEYLKTQAAAYLAARKTFKVRRAKRTKAIEHTKAIEQK